MKLAGRGGAFEPKVPSPVPEGHLLAGKYRVEKVLGAGGMGVVVSATHIHIGQRVAIKFLLPHALADEQTLERFAREARALARLESEHVGRVIDVGALDTGQPYIVLEGLTGRNLAELMDARGALDVDEATGYIIEACQAMAEAHALGIIHRDLKPENLFLAERADGTRIIKVIDFGVSKISAESMATRTGGRVTSTSAVIGSPLYMSPEQLLAARDVDARTDIWSLGVTLYELLTGQGPFRWRTLPELCAAILKDAPRLLREVRHDAPEGLEAVVMSCLEKEPARRPGSAAALAWELLPFARQSVLPGRSTISPAAISVRESHLPARERPLLEEDAEPTADTERAGVEAWATAPFPPTPLFAHASAPWPAPAEPTGEPRCDEAMRPSLLTPPVGLSSEASTRAFKIRERSAAKAGLTALIAAGIGASVVLAASPARAPVITAAARAPAIDGVAPASAPSESAASAKPSPMGTASAAEEARDAPPFPRGTASAAEGAKEAPSSPERKPERATLNRAPQAPKPGGGRPFRPSYPQSAFDHRK